MVTLTKLFATAAVVSCSFFIANAGDNNKTTDDAKAKVEAPAEIKAAATSFQYAVTGVVNIGGTDYYQVGAVTGNEPCEEGTPNACIITSSVEQSSGRVPQSQATIDEYRLVYDD